MTEPCTFVVFGATGDLSRKKLFRALYRLEKAGQLPPQMTILGSVPPPENKEDFNQHSWPLYVREKCLDEIDEDSFQRFQARLHHLSGDLEAPEIYQNLRQKLDTDNNMFPLNAKGGKNVIFYLAIPPSLFSKVVKNLKGVGLVDEDNKSWRRVVIEKPFGSDLDSARTLHKELMECLTESQTYRIDHYLGKSTVQNLLVFRFANALIEPLWNCEHIDHVQISHAETAGVGKRMGYYEKAGALRDMIQSHLLQVLALIAMENPIMQEQDMSPTKQQAIRDKLMADALHTEKLKVLQAIQVKETSRAQYGSGVVQGEVVKSYQEEVNAASHTETYAAMQLSIENQNNRRWDGVPFYIRTGKRLQEKQAMVSICFKNNVPNLSLFESSPNWIYLGIDPECLLIESTIKEPTLGGGVKSVKQTRQRNLVAHFREVGDIFSDAYDDLILDLIDGDQSLFLRYDEIEASWKIVQPILDSWKTADEAVEIYHAGVWTPKNSLMPSSPETTPLSNEKMDWRHLNKCE